MGPSYFNIKLLHFSSKVVFLAIAFRAVMRPTLKIAVYSRGARNNA